jgi:hypothetical protein
VTRPNKHARPVMSVRLITARTEFVAPNRPVRVTPRAPSGGPQLPDSPYHSRTRHAAQSSGYRQTPSAETGRYLAMGEALVSSAITPVGRLRVVIRASPGSQARRSQAPSSPRSRAPVQRPTGSARRRHWRRQSHRPDRSQHPWRCIRRQDWRDRDWRACQAC